MFKLVNDKGEVYKVQGVEIHFKTREDAIAMWSDKAIAKQYPICTETTSIYRRLLNGFVWTSPSGATH